MNIANIIIYSVKELENTTLGRRKWHEWRTQKSNKVTRLDHVCRLSQTLVFSLILPSDCLPSQASIPHCLSFLLVLPLPQNAIPYLILVRLQVLTQMSPHL